MGNFNAVADDSDLAAARADLVDWCATCEVLKTYTAEQLEALAVFVAVDRVKRRGCLEDVPPPSRDEIIPEAGGENT